MVHWRSRRLPLLAIRLGKKKVSASIVSVSISPGMSRGWVGASPVHWHTSGFSFLLVSVGRAIVQSLCTSKPLRTSWCRSDSGQVLVTRSWNADNKRSSGRTRSQPIRRIAGSFCWVWRSANGWITIVSSGRAKCTTSAKGLGKNRAMGQAATS